MKRGAKNRSNTRKILNNKNVHTHAEEQGLYVLETGWTVALFPGTFSWSTWIRILE